MIAFNLDIPSMTSEGIELIRPYANVKELSCTSENGLIYWILDDALEYVITKNGDVTPSEHLLSLYGSVLWIFRSDQMEEISISVEHILIQGRVGREEENSFRLSNLPSLTTLEMGYGAYCKCHSSVFESEKIEWMMIEIWLDFNLSLLDGALLEVTRIIENRMNW